MTPLVPASPSAGAISGADRQAAEVRGVSSHDKGHSVFLTEKKLFYFVFFKLGENQPSFTILQRSCSLAV